MPDRPSLRPPLRYSRSGSKGTSIIERVTEKAVQGAYGPLEQREDEAEEQNNVGGNRYVDRVFNRGPRRRY
jgi:hypothetical protein